MDDETPEMQAISNRMREVMEAWVADPANQALKRQYSALQRRYQRLFLDYKQRQIGNGTA